MSISKLLQRRAGYINFPSTQSIFPIASRSATRSYVHFLTVSGEILGTIDVGTNTYLQGANYYRYSNFMYIFRHYAFSDYIKVDLNTFTYTTGSITNAVGRGQFSPISNSKLIRVSGPDQKYYIFDLATETETAFNYTAATHTGIAQTHGTLTFFDYSPTGVTNVSDQIWWSAANTGATNYYSEFNYATLTGVTLTPRTMIFDGANYSRNYALTVNSTKGLFWMFDSQLHTIEPETSTLTAISPSTFIENSDTYSYQAPQGYDIYGVAAASVNSSPIHYGSWRGPPGFKLCTFDPFSSTNPTPTPISGIDIPPDPYAFYVHPEAVLTPLNENGDVFFAYFDHSVNNYTIKCHVIRGSTILQTNEVQVPTETVGNTGYESRSRASPGAQSYLGPIQSGSTIL